MAIRPNIIESMNHHRDFYGGMLIGLATGIALTLLFGTPGTSLYTISLVVTSSAFVSVSVRLLTESSIVRMTTHILLRVVRTATYVSTIILFQGAHWPIWILLFVGIVGDSRKIIKWIRERFDSPIRSRERGKLIEEK